MQKKKKEFEQKKDNKQPQKNPRFSDLTRELKIEAKYVTGRLDDITKNEIKDEYCYLISAQAIKNWKEYVDYDNIMKDDKPVEHKFSKKPEKINEDLIIVDKEFLQFPDKDHPCAAIVKPNLEKDKDYLIINQELWEYFEKKYGGITIKRKFTKDENNKMIVINDIVTITLIFVYTSYLQMLENKKVDQLKIKKLQIPIDMNIKELKSSLSKSINRLGIFKYNIDSSSIRIWKMDPKLDTTDKLKEHLYKSCASSRTYDYQITFDGQLCDRDQHKKVEEIRSQDEPIIIEINEPGKLWIFYNELVKACKKCDFCGRIDFIDHSCVCKKVGYCSEDCKYNDKAAHSKKCDVAYDSDENKEIDSRENPANGLCGLDNLGNTCYMNSALQCLSNIPELKQYFLSQKYKGDINEENPLGSKGKLAKKFAFLLKKLWLDDEKSYAPHSFKFAMSKYQTMFHGCNQHDPNEFLFYLLDALHEDLNLIKKKPFTEASDSNNRPDHEVAKEYWQLFLLRNRSVIVDYMYGQYKSSVTCTVCQNSSTTFETYSICTIPIPIQKEIEVFYVHSDYSNKPYRVLVKYPNESHKISDLKDDLAYLLDKDVNNVVMALGNSDTINILTDLSGSTAETIKKLDKAFLFACELEEKSFKIPFEKKIYLGLKTVRKERSGNLTKLGVVRLLCLDRTLTNQDIHLSIFSKYRFIFDENWQFRTNTPFSNFSTERALDEIWKKFNEPYKMSITYANDTSKKIEVPYDQGCILLNIDDSNQIIIEVEWNNLPDVFDLDIFKAFLRHDPYKHGSNKDQLNSDRKLVDIKDCLESFREPEELKDNDSWYCKKCKRHQTAIKKMEIYNAPPIFAIHLKRFKGPDGTRWNRTESKITDLVTFPIENFNMTPYVCTTAPPMQNSIDSQEEHKENSSAVYDLFGVLHHIGNLNSGHCIAHCKHPETGDWYLFDDDKIKKVIMLDELITDTAYVLFYKKRA